MKKQGILHVNLSAAIAAIGHTDYLVIADSGLPVPPEVELIDLALVAGIPSFSDVLEAICSEMIIEKYTIASDLIEAESKLPQQICKLVGENIPFDIVTHEQFKKLSAHAKYLVRTGECTPFSNIILMGGTGF